MDTTKYESWNLRKITKALEEHNVDNVKIEVPMFQRNLVWSEEQKKTFIDSVKKGFPIGTLLFYKVKDKDTYSLIDGLQRSTTIKDFMKSPTSYFETQDVDDEVIETLYKLFERNTDKREFYETMRMEIQEYVRQNDLSSSNLSYDLAKMLVERYAKKEDLKTLDKTVNAVTPCIEEFSKLYEEIAQSPIPVMIFSGDESDLPTVFERINNQGTLLGKYQIYAASWAVKNYTVVIENEEVLNHIIAKYDDFVSEGFELSGYDRNAMLDTRQVSLFEYALGFGKYISDKYDKLFVKNKSLLEINQIGFELLNACFGCHNKQIKDLHEKLNTVDINLLEKRLDEIIQLIDGILAPFIGFKANSRGNIPIYHAQYQIVSIIACTFREKYNINNLDKEKIDWKQKYALLKMNIPQHYVFDIIARVWSDGSLGKLYSTLNDNKYLRPIEKSLWETKLEDWLNNTLTRREKTNVASPKPVEKLFLNCIFVNTITAREQLSPDVKFDIEHLATKEILKKVIKKHSWEGMPISSIANICYLPEYDNRAKKGKTIYQNKAYLEYIETKGLTLNDIESKYTFTERNDLQWLEECYSNDQYSEYLDKYCDFLKRRFVKMKEAFYTSLGIE